MNSHLNTVDVPLTSYTNGFLNYQYDSTIKVSSNSLTIMFANEGTVVYSGSRRKTMLGTLSATFPPGNGGQYYFYIDDSFNLVYAYNPTATQVGEIILKYALVAIGAWSASKNNWVVLTDERHGATKFSIDHLTEHLTIGAEYESGFDVTAIVAGDGSGKLPSVTVANGKQQDEDLRHDIYTSGGINQLFNIGGVWERYGYLGSTLLLYAVAGKPQFNRLSGGVWSMQPVPANHYFVVYLYTVPTVQGSSLPSLYAITASQTFANKNEAQAFAKRAPQLAGLPSQEMLLCYSFLLQHKTTSTNSVYPAIVKLDDGSDYYDWRNRSPTSVGGGIVPQQWAMLRSTAATGASTTVPLIMMGQDATNAHTVTNGIVDLLPNKTYIISAGLSAETDTKTRSMAVQKSTDGTSWSAAFGSGYGGHTSGTSIEDVLVTTQPMKLRIVSASKGLSAGVWLRLQVM